MINHANGLQLYCVRTQAANIIIIPHFAMLAIKKAHLQSSVFKLSKDLIDSIHEEGIVAYTS